MKDENFKLRGYNTYIYKKDNNIQTRMIGTIKFESECDIKQRFDLQFPNYPLISFKLNLRNSKNIIFSGLYRTWSNNQKEELKNICNIIDVAAQEE